MALLGAPDEALAVIGDLEIDPATTAPQLHPDLANVTGVLFDVVQAFLSDTIQRRGQHRLAFAAVEIGLEVNADGFALYQVRTEALQGRHQPQIVEHAGAQVVGQPPQILNARFQNAVCRCQGG